MHMSRDGGAVAGDPRASPAVLSSPAWSEHKIQRTGMVPRAGAQHLWMLCWATWHCCYSQHDRQGHLVATLGLSAHSGPAWPPQLHAAAGALPPSYLFTASRPWSPGSGSPRHPTLGTHRGPGRVRWGTIQAMADGSGHWKKDGHWAGS